MKIILPLSVLLPRKKKEDRVWILNLNSYRNTHYQILNQAKVIYKDKVYVEGLMPHPPYAFIYTIYPANKRKFDLGNVLPVIGKFTEDALVEMGVIKDDNYSIIREIQYRFGEVDKHNPRCELTIETH